MTAPIVYVFDEDGYFRHAKEAQRSPNPKTPNKYLFPVNSTTVKPEIPDGYEGRWNKETQSWEYEKIPTTAEDFIGVQVSHKKQTEHFRRLRSIIQSVTKDNPLYRIKRGSQEEGLWWGVEAIPEKTQDEKDLEAAQQQEQQLMQKLRDTDYVAAKLAEGVATKEEYSDVLAQRAEWREQINGLRATQQTLTAKISGEVE